MIVTAPAADISASGENADVVLDAQALKPLYDTLQRYAGWLDRERSSVLVRADVQALGVALDQGADLTLLLDALDANLKRLPSGAVRKMLRAASATIRRTLAAQRL